jgi:hypothetical protein
VGPKAPPYRGPNVVDERPAATILGRCSNVDAARLIAAVRSIQDESDPTRLMRLTVPTWCTARPTATAGLEGPFSFISRTVPHRCTQTARS